MSARRLLGLVPLFCLLLAAAPAGAGTTDNKGAGGTGPASAGQAASPRWWTVGGDSVTSGEVSGAGSLDIVFAPDRKLCRERYGDEWHVMCARRTGLEGRPVVGAALSPAMPGEWRWTSDMGLTFRPGKPWPADTAYRATLPARALPAGVVVTRPLTFRTSPVRVSLAGDFKFDPLRPADMGISGTASFNYPMDRDGVRLTVEAGGPAGGAPLLGDLRLEWSEEGNLLFFSVPVRDLPAGASTARVKVAEGARAASGGSPAPAAALVLNLPGADTLFQLTGADAAVVSSADLRARQTLVLQFSMPVDPSGVRAALRVLLLPRQRVEGDAGRPPYVWWSRDELTPEIRAAARPVELEAVAGGDDEPTMTVSFPLAEEVEAGRFLLVSLPAGVRGSSGLATAGPAEFLVRVPALESDLRVMQAGAVLALTGDRTLSIYSRNLDAVTYEAAQVRPEFVNHLVSRGGDFASPGLSDTDLYELAAVTRGRIPLEIRDAESPQFSALDLGPLLADGRKGLFLLRLTGMRGEEAVASDSRFVLVTDLGLIRKIGADGSGPVYVVSLASGRPVAGADVRVLGANGLPVFEARADADGRVDVPSLKGMTRERRPVAVTASRKGDLAFLPLDDRDREVNYGRSDVGGTGVRAGGLLAYLFGERDMYRPGETVHFGYIVRQGRWESDRQEGLPLVAEVRDPRGNLFARADLRLAADGFGELGWPLPETAAVGPYHCDLMLNDGDGSGPVLASADFRVEEFQSDTLRLAVRLTPAAPPAGWLRPRDVLEDSPEGFRTRLQLDSLFGAPAPDHAVRAVMESSPARFSFPEYPDWTFYDATPAPRHLSEALPEARTDADGRADLVLPPSFWADASRMLTIRARGMDAAGGRAVMAADSALVSPMEAVVGWKCDADPDYLPQGGGASLRLLALGPDAKPRGLGDVRLETLAVVWNRSLIRGDDGRYRYENRRREKTTSDRVVSFPAEGLEVPLDLSRSGEWVLAVRDAKGGTLARIPYTVAGDAPAILDEQREPTLTVRLSRKDYEPGGEVEAFVSTPYKGSGLIAVERDGVAASAWFRSDGGDTVQRLRLPADFEGRAYLSVLYFRSPDDADIFTRPMASAVVPFTVNMDGRDLGLKLDVPPEATVFAAGSAGESGTAVVRPGSFPVRLSARRPGRAVVFAVDEGILQLTSYRSPDPLRALLGDRALQVSTLQFFDLLMPEYSRMKAALSAYGGGEGPDQALAGLNPFRRPGEKAAVFWSGLMDVGPEAVVTDIPVPPSFSGRMRVMAVACGPSGVGSARTDVQVRAEVVIQPSLPLFAAPGDEFEVVAALTDESGIVPRAGTEGRAALLEAEAGPGLEAVDGGPREVLLRPGRETRESLRFRVLDAPGGTSVTFRVSPLPGEPGGVAIRPAGLSVRPASPRVARLETGRIGADPFRAEVPFTRRLYPQYASTTASVSALPLPVAHGLMSWLEGYPYGCTEQIVSAAFPALFALRWPEYSPPGEAWTPEALRQRATAALEVLQARYRGDGDFALWPDGYRGGLFLTVYAADFVVSAEEAGVSVPPGFRNRLLSALRSRLEQTPVDFDEARIAAYGAWVLTRGGVLATGTLSTLTAWLDQWEKGWESDVTAAFMAGCWRLMMDRKEADRLLDGVRFDRDSRGGGWLDPLSRRALYLSVLAMQFPERLAGAGQALDEMLDLAADGRSVTVSAAQAVRALMVWSRASAVSLASASVIAVDRDGNALESIGTGSAAEGGGAVRSASLTNGDDALPELAAWRFQASGPAYWQVESVGFDRDLPDRPDFRGMEVAREFRTPDGEPATIIRQGDELVVALRARSYGGTLENVALTDLLPGGFEMALTEGGGALEVGTDRGARSDDRPMMVEHAERREDRLLLFPTLETEETVFRYRVRAVTRGSFVLPPLTGEAMYDPAVRAITAAGRVEVE